MQDTTDGGTPPNQEDGGAPSRMSRWVRPVAFGAAGLLAGGLLAGTLTASADESSTDSSSGSSTMAPGMPGGPSGDQSQPQRSDEELLTGSKAAKVEAAVLAEYPGATILRLETDSDGVYEAHLTTAAGDQVTVEVDSDFTVTGTEAYGGPGGHGGPPPPADGSATDSSETGSSAT